MSFRSQLTSTYKSTAYNARCGAELSTSIRPHGDFTPWNRPWADIKVTARLIRSFGNRSLCPGFEVQSNPKSVFRPGQIFEAQINSDFQLYNHRTFRDIDFGNLPLDSIPMLEATAENEKLEDRAKHLAQVRQLPLDKMTRYCQDVADNRKKVKCLLCTDPEKLRESIYLKDEWASDHFRRDHWIYYFAMVPKLEDRLDELPRRRRELVIPWQRQSEEHAQPADLKCSPDGWITFEDVASDTPIDTDDEIFDVIARFSSREHHSLPGPVLIQRFVVVREGSRECLCVGIHTSVKHLLTMSRPSYLVAQLTRIKVCETWLRPSARPGALW